MWRLFLAGHDAQLDFFEAGQFQPMMQLALLKSRPTVPVQFAGFFKIMFQ
jgi:hypothetical protein